jgi:guanosine-3',5'-bis(diphosphate) 3'-pyrophosphohydrolase
VEAARREAPEWLLEELLGLLRSPRRSHALEVFPSFTEEEIAEIEKAFWLAAEAHAGQLRKSGEPFLVHPVEVARIVAEQGMDAKTVTASLLHDVVEDGGVEVSRIASEFGEDVALIVDGITKLEKLHFDSATARKAASYRKMLVAVAADWRVLVIKLADRLHNMRTIGFLEPAKAKAVAQETLDIFAPLAHRLGMFQVQCELEDLAFAVVYPERYEEIKEMVRRRAPGAATYLQDLTAALRRELEKAGIKADVQGRPKHLWSIYQKMVSKGKTFDEIYDLVGIRVVVATEKECWAALGVIHSLWPPVPNRFKDYINSPKFNLYQSLHTTVVGPGGKHVEAQIRTWEMHLRAERGIAAHWSYKGRAIGSLKDEMEWFRRILEVSSEDLSPIEYLNTLKADLEKDEVYVFTPKGMVVTLPAGATPIDFAYAVHTEVGHRCIGARVDGKLVPLDTKLRSGQTVEILTSRAASAGPSRDWLAVAVSSRARAKIRQWFAKERREDAIELGKEELTKAFRKARLDVKLMSSPVFSELLSALGFSDLDGLLAAIGEGHVSCQGVVARLTRLAETEARDGVVPVPAGHRQEDPSSAVAVAGIGDVAVRLSRCCKPMPPDEIKGFVTRGRGLSVHRVGCPNLIALATAQPERVMKVTWSGTHGSFASEIRVEALDRPGLLADISRVFVENHAHITACKGGTAKDRIARFSFECELSDPMQYAALVSALKRVDGVYSAGRAASAPS